MFARTARAAALAGSLILAALFASPLQATPSIAIPASGAQGDCFAVTIAGTSAETRNVAEGNSANVKLLAPSGRAISTAPLFRTQLAERPQPTGTSEPTAFAALVAIPADAESGSYTVVVTAAGEEVSRSPFEIIEKLFPSETVELNAQNTAIKQDSSPARKEQIKNLDDILFSHDDSAQRFDGPFVAPVSSTRRTSQFWHNRTYRYSNGKKELSIHYGIDFGVPKGTPVIAAGAGRVAMAENRVSTGLTVVIEHAPGIFSLYYHLSELLVSEGQSVATGDLIARSGSTGLSTGPHLHWEMRVNGTAVSPDWFVGRKLW